MQACQFNGGELVAVTTVLPGRYHSKHEKGGLDSPPPSSNWRRSEIERHAARDGLERRTADRVVGRIARANLIAVAARAEAVVSPCPLRELGRHDVPARPVVEVVARTNGILVGGIAEQVGLVLANRPHRRNSSA